jgi:uncharacterized protein (DUF488 family)
MSQLVELFTIGFTQKTAEQFFGSLIEAGVQRVIDTRLNNVSQLAGFAKRADLGYFLTQLGGIDYVHCPELAPTQAMLDAYKKHKGSWADYAASYQQLLDDRQIATTLNPDLLHSGCLLCSEAKPDFCHRRLVADYLQAQWGNIAIRHL